MTQQKIDKLKERVAWLERTRRPPRCPRCPHCSPYYLCGRCFQRSLRKVARRQQV